jgi:hypothetical protein
MSKKLLKTAGVFAALVLGGYFAQAQHVNTTAGVPVYKNTGDAAADQARYESEKQFYLTHMSEVAQPKSAEQMEAEKAAAKQAAANLIVITTDDYNTLSPEKKAYINANPSQYVVKEKVTVITRADYNSVSPEKRAYIDANPSLYTVENNTK